MQRLCANEVTLWWPMLGACLMWRFCGAVHREEVLQPSRNVLHWVRLRELMPSQPRGTRAHVRALTSQSVNQSVSQSITPFPYT